MQGMASTGQRPEAVQVPARGPLRSSALAAGAVVLWFVIPTGWVLAAGFVGTRLGARLPALVTALLVFLALFVCLPVTWIAFAKLLTRLRGEPWTLSRAVRQATRTTPRPRAFAPSLRDPADSGGLFVRRQGAPHRRAEPLGVPDTRRAVDRALAALVLAVEALVLATLWGPQPLAWLWFGSHVQYWTGSVEAAIVSAFIGMLCTLLATVSLAKVIDHWWKLIRRAGGHDQQRGALERMFIVSVGVALFGFLLWFAVVAGPNQQLMPQPP
jgi:hypothetical protein